MREFLIKLQDNLKKSKIRKKSNYNDIDIINDEYQALSNKKFTYEKIQMEYKKNIQDMDFIASQIHQMKNPEKIKMKFLKI